ncbi:MAG: hypothetical protein OXC53_08580, partial [Rhodobacteraceae bacterium]|nr:hypothetical protein [Paracoccaceae bacterium]
FLLCAMRYPLQDSAAQLLFRILSAPHGKTGRYRNNIIIVNQAKAINCAAQSRLPWPGFNRIRR